MKKIFISVLLLTIFIACDNENGNTQNEDTCENAGLSYVDTSNNETVYIDDLTLSTQFFPNASNGPYGAPGVEITDSQNFSVTFITNVIDENQSGTGFIILNQGTPMTVNVTCQRAGTAIGDELRYDVTTNGYEFEYCVKIDEVL